MILLRKIRDSLSEDAARNAIQTQSGRKGGPNCRFPSEWFSAPATKTPFRPKVPKIGSQMDSYPLNGS